MCNDNICAMVEEHFRSVSSGVNESVVGGVLDAHAHVVAVSPFTEEECVAGLWVIKAHSVC